METTQIKATRKQRQNGGAKEPFPVAVEEGAGNALELWRLIEVAQRHYEDKTLPLKLRREWGQQMDLLQEAQRQQLVLVIRTATTHAQAVSGQTTPLCRVYQGCERSVKQMEVVCGGRCEECGPKVA